jgi:3'(2'), 5'-bisphosphate nucleotidase
MQSLKCNNQVINIDALKKLALKAGDAIMEVYQSGFSVTDKPDFSPVTEADIVSHNIIAKGLSVLTPDIPILSEESVDDVKNARVGWGTFWLVDPLDGTKEFIKGNGEFTVNIALIKGGVPVFGLIYIPVTQVFYWGAEGEGAFKQALGADVESIRVANLPSVHVKWRVVGSRSHQSPEFDRFVSRLPQAAIITIGSSLKLCLIAEGIADIYPRLTPTSEWDIAAGHAIVNAAGGQVLLLSSLTPLVYNTDPNSLINPDFIACAEPSLIWSRN